MKRGVAEQITKAVERLRRESVVPPNSEGLFDLIVELAELVASRDDLVWARERELEPDALARRFFSDAESVALGRVSALIPDLSDTDLRRFESILQLLERQHGRAPETLPNHRLLVDGAVLGGIGFCYNRKFQEVLAACSLQPGQQPDLLTNLLGQVDLLFPSGPPRYLWRLGPEFGIDRNIRLLAGRGDDFIVRSLYPSRARRLSRHVLRWEKLPDGQWIGENCEEDRYGFPVRHLVIRPTNGGRHDARLLLTNLANSPWQDIYRLYRNRSGKLSSRVQIDSASTVSLRRRVAAGFFIVALLALRNVNTWAAVQTDTLKEQITVAAEVEQRERTIEIFDTRLNSESLDTMQHISDYLMEVAGDGDKLDRLAASVHPHEFLLRVEAGTSIPAAGDGKVLFIDRIGSGSESQSVVIYHGRGLSSTYSNLTSVSADLKVGDAVTAGDALGVSGHPTLQPVHFAPRMSQRYLSTQQEPSVAEVLSPEQNLFLDPIGILVDVDSRMAAGDLTALDIDVPEPYTAPKVAYADLFVMYGEDLPSGVVFLGPADTGDTGLESDYTEPLDEDLLFASLTIETLFDDS